MKIRTGSPVILKTFLGEDETPPGIPAFEDYWKLIGTAGEVIKGEPGEKLVLVEFEADLYDLGLASHDEQKNTLFIMKSDLSVDEEKLKELDLTGEKPELVSCMTDQKWFKLLNILLKGLEHIAYLKVKYILDEKLYDYVLQDEGDFDQVSLREKDNVVVLFKEIQHLMIYCKKSETDEQKNGTYLLAQDLKSQGQFSVDITPDCIKVYGYEYLAPGE